MLSNETRERINALSLEPARREVCHLRKEQRDEQCAGTMGGKEKGRGEEPRREGEEVVPKRNKEGPEYEVMPLGGLPFGFASSTESEQRMKGSGIELWTEPRGSKE